MKIGIITFHNAWNCGAVLQCVALKNSLELMGHEVCVINYCPSYQKIKYEKYPNPFKCAQIEIKNFQDRNTIKRILLYGKCVIKTVLNYSPNSTRLVKKVKFNSFCNQNFNLTQCYSSIKELEENPPKCDVYISGSDQVWNPKLTDDKIDEAYYLNFGSFDVTRIGYAISTCQLDTDAQKTKLNDLLVRFDKLSLRENEKKEELEKIYKDRISICIDPTFLLKKEDYQKYEEPLTNILEPYILIYAFDYKDQMEVFYNTVNRIKKLYNLPVKVINGPHHWPFEVEFFKPKDGISPGEFLSYIKNAEIIITNSFHATTFSIIYKKDFYTLTVQERSSRVIELLEKLGLRNRLILGDADMKNLSKKSIDYSFANQKIEELRDFAIDYLLDGIKM